MTTLTTVPWWETGLVYQIYPRSFQDSNGDGIGDLNGIRTRLPYLQDLGVTTLWLSPIYPSPMADFGYDVSDYTDIHPLFGTLDDFMALLADAHQRGLKLILDFVPNHTSDQHPWFLESRSRRDNPKRDWYLWQNAKPDGRLPNNWVSAFGGPAWEWDAATEQYYLHLFAKEQPDLNWRNPEVVDAMFDAMRFWLGRGIDGFRVDVIWMVIKDALFRDETPNPDWTPAQPLTNSTLHDRTQNQPEVHDVIRQMRGVLDAYGNRVLIGEIYEPYERLVTYYGSKLDECHLPFNFHLILCPFQADVIQASVAAYERALPAGAWPNWVLGNHDQDRIASVHRAGAANARLAQMLLLTLRGTPAMYYGDELGMPNADIPPDQYQDPQAVNEPGVGRSRDVERTPMQWDASPQAGFSTGAPWLPVTADYAWRNVQAQNAEPHSMLQMVKRLIALRQSSPALNHGSYAAIPAVAGEVMAYLRTAEAEQFLIVLNFAAQDHVVNLATPVQKGQIVLSSHSDRTEEVILSALKIRRHEGLIIRMCE